MYPLSRKAIKCRVQPLKKKPEKKQAKHNTHQREGKTILFFSSQSKKMLSTIYLKLAGKHFPLHHKFHKLEAR